MNVLHLALFLGGLSAATSSLAASACPDIGYVFEGGSRDGRTCLYANEISLGLTWDTEPEGCFSGAYKRVLWENREPLESDGEGAALYLTSRTHAATAYARLNVKEMHKNRRAFWIEILEKQLRVAEERATACTSPEMLEKFEAGFAPVACPETRVKRDLTRLPPGLKDEFSPQKGQDAPVDCSYANDIHLQISWRKQKSDQSSCAGIPAIEPVGVAVKDDRYKSITLKSATGLSEVFITLNEREISGENREYWIGKGKETLLLAEIVARDCSETSSKSSPVSRAPLKQQTKPILPRATTLQPPSPPIKDSWDAPSPKAKIPD